MHFSYFYHRFFKQDKYFGIFLAMLRTRTKKFNQILARGKGDKMENVKHFPVLENKGSNSTWNESI